MTHAIASQHATPEGVIDLARGDPSPDFLPLDAVRDAAARITADGDVNLLQYGHEPGDPAFRELLAATFGGSDGDPERWFVTPGASAALSLICTLFAGRGDGVVVADPSYHLALRTFRDHGLQVRSVPSDDGGPDPEAWAAALTEPVPGGGRVALAYLVPAFGNPTGVTLASERARHLTEACALHGVRLIADEVYRPLALDGDPPPSLAAADAEPASEVVLALGSVSKFLSPALRVGWIHGPARDLRRLADAGLLRSGGGMNPFTAAIVHELLRSGAAQERLHAVRAELRSRRDALHAALRRELPDATFVPAEGGYFAWVRTPGVRIGVEEGAGADGGVAEALRRHRVVVAPGMRFVADARRAPDAAERARLSFGHEPPERLAEAVVRLAAAVRASAEASPT
ncbi:MAG: PLP-dependent aminotransferase family protein [Trueperaceae bacterium]